MKLLTAIQTGTVVKTKVAMPYGRTRYDIEAAGVEHQSELQTPGSTLAIRGTEVSVYDQPPFAPSAVSLTGRAVYTAAKRQIAFGGKGKGKTEVSSTTDTPAQYSLLKTFVDPTSSFGRPPQDQALLNQLQSKGDVLLNNGQLAIAYGGAVTDAQLTELISSQGRFNISLRWFGPGDFDLFVLLPDPATNQPKYTLGNPSYNGSPFKDLGFIGDTVPPPSAATTPDGGRIKFDQIALGGGGIELASWDTPVPQIGYTLAIVYYDQRGRIKNYPTSSKFRVDAFLDGKRVPVLTNFDQIVLQTATELKFAPTWTDSIDLNNVLNFEDPETTLGVVQPDGRLAGLSGSAVDLTPLATYVDGTPIGNINPTVQASIQRSIKAAQKRGAKATPPAKIPTVVAKPTRVPTVVAKPPVMGPRVPVMGPRAR
jgi:hypothetical protein